MLATPRNGPLHDGHGMASLSSSTVQRAADAWPSMLRLALASALFWALAAGLLSIAAPGLDSFGRLLVFNESVGMTIVGLAVLLRPSRWLPKVHPTLGWLATGLIAIPTGYVVGHALAFLILGEPFRILSHGSDRMVPIVFTVLIAGFGLHYFASRERLAKEAAARSEAQRLATEAQLRLLRAQLEPHMLFNTLANLRSLVREDSQQAELMIDQLITYLRSALSASRTETSTLVKEFTQLRAYLDIMSLRMGPRLQCLLDLPAELEQVSVPPMLLQPLVENAIKHGLEPKVGAGSITVMARRCGAGVEIKVTDTGLGLPTKGDPGHEVDANSGGYGLQHVRERLQACYGSKATLTLCPQAPTGMCASVRIPA
jgi:signal transduction histidine kinase